MQITEICSPRKQGRLLDVSWEDCVHVQVGFTPWAVPFLFS